MQVVRRRRRMQEEGEALSAATEWAGLGPEGPLGEKDGEEESYNPRPRFFLRSPLRVALRMTQGEGFSSRRPSPSAWRHRRPGGLSIEDLCTDS